MAAAAGRAVGSYAAAGAVPVHDHDSDDEKYASPDGSQAGHTDADGDDHADNETIATAGEDTQRRSIGGARLRLALQLLAAGPQPSLCLPPLPLPLLLQV